MTEEQKEFLLRMAAMKKLRDEAKKIINNA